MIVEAEGRPTVWIHERFNGGRSRFGWECSGCHAAATRITTRSAVHDAAGAHRCPEETT